MFLASQFAVPSPMRLAAAVSPSLAAATMDNLQSVLMEEGDVVLVDNYQARDARLLPTMRAVCVAR
eukprot:scaffold112568_cov32-Tisochrysis_lutea.AAC.2